MSSLVCVTNSVLAKVVLMELGRSGVAGLGGEAEFNALPGGPLGPPAKGVHSVDLQCDPESGIAVRLTTLGRVRSGRYDVIRRFEVIRGGVLHRAESRIPEFLTEDLRTVLRRISPVIKRLVRTPGPHKDRRRAKYVEAA